MYVDDDLTRRLELFKTNAVLTQTDGGNLKPVK